ncbi:hypothetical protein TIFTF001_027046 [Ficus carica]|uniref:Uncharacterized protein n=1 Tax=Ficus carica TaxID=3494 RepID=A0AA88IZM3_FICCA|nr:hypothetical protein TIFTF001_027046 [Ficus carica]
MGELRSGEGGIVGGHGGKQSQDRGRDLVGGGGLWGDRRQAGGAGSRGGCSSPAKNKGGGKSGRGIAAYGGSGQVERRANSEVIVRLAGESEKRVGEEDMDEDGQRRRKNDVGLPGRGEDL